MVSFPLLFSSADIRLFDIYFWKSISNTQEWNIYTSMVSIYAMYPHPLSEIGYLFIFLLYL